MRKGIDKFIPDQVCGWHRQSEKRPNYVNLGKEWKNIRSLGLSNRPRKTFVANFRAATDHEQALVSISRGIKSSTICNLCNDEEQTSLHLMRSKALDVRDIQTLFKS